MKKYYVIEPEVAGGFGENCEIDWSTGKMQVNKLHYQFDGWLGDELLESTPCYIASERLAKLIQQHGLSGVEFDKVEITRSEQFREIYPNRLLPNFVWLKVTGIPEQHDFAIASGLQLVVSERTLNLLKTIGTSHMASIT
jgi:hypothetical protein